MSNSINQSAGQRINYFPHSADNQSKDSTAEKTTYERLENPFASLNDRTLDALLSVLKGLIDTVEDYIAPEDEPNNQQEGATDQHDCLCGTSDDDKLNGHGGDDSLYGGSGDDALKGGDGEDRLFGGSGDDFLTGQKGDDHLFGGSGDDTLGGPNNGHEWGIFGNDFMDGGSGDDIIRVGTGNNTLLGGSGYDTTIFEGKPIDYTFSLDEEGRLVANNKEHDKQSTIENIEVFQFNGLEDKEFTQEDLLNNKGLSDRKDFMLYGDPSLNRMVVMKLSTFEQVQNIPIDGEKVYSADHITDDKAYIMPRGSNFIQVLNRNGEGEFVAGEKVELPFHPRTGAKNKALGLELISGTDKPMFALVDTHADKVLATGGRDIVTEGTINNYDGENATGHAQWISDDQFLFGDRESHELALYRVNKDQGQWTVEKTDSITSSSSIHTFFGKKEVADDEYTVYASMEGDENGNNASIAELRVMGDSLVMERQADISAGTHHPGLHPDGKHMYVPTADGKVEIIDRESMTIVGSVKAGKGAGHVVMIPERDLALIVNHNDTFMTAINLTTHQKIKDFEVATDVPEYSQSLQAHTGRVSPDKDYFYNFATDSGTFFRVDLETLEVDKTLYVEGTPKQAAQPGELF